MEIRDRETYVALSAIAEEDGIQIKNTVSMEPFCTLVILAEEAATAP